MKKIKTALAALLAVLILAGCSYNASEPLVYKPNNTQKPIVTAVPDDTTAGSTEEVTLDGNAIISSIGQPFTDEEITAQINLENRSIPDGCYVSRNGYYHVMLGTLCLNYNYYTLPVIKDDVIVGEISLSRRDDGTVETACIAEFPDGYNLARVLGENKGKKFALVYSEFSEYAIMDDNTVYTIYGFTPEIIDKEKLFNAFAANDNIISDSIYDTSSAIPITASATAPNDKLPVKQDDIGTSMNKFAFKLYDEIESDENLFFSPYSINVALSMLDNGAENETKSEIELLLGITDINERNQQLNTLMNSFDDDRAVLKTANSVWMSDKYPFSDRMNGEFLAPLQNLYGAGAFKADLSNPKAIDDINGWISDNTGGMIKRMITDLDDSSAMVLVNAVYFEGKWSSPFLAERTYESDFFGKNGTTTVKMMNDGMCYLQYNEAYGMKGVRMPYGDGSVAMDIFVAVDGSEKSAVELFGELSEAERLKMFSGLNKAKIMQLEKLSIPKFKFENETLKLKDALTALGMTDSFNYSAADFGILNDEIYISQVSHKAVIEVDELGSKAAAATVVDMAAGCAPAEEEPLRFIADEPFVFTITDTETGTILFMGTINDL